MGIAQKRYDIFISHATEDKTGLVRPLADALSNLGYRVWYDEFTISVGDGLRRSIDKGIANSRFGVVILSKSFFNKGWTNYELDGLLQIDIDNPDEGVILPIWYDVTKKDVLAYSPSLANKYAINTDGTNIIEVVSELEKKLGDYIYTVNNDGNLIRSDRKVNIDLSKREHGFQIITNHISHRLFNREKSVITSDTIIYPYTKDFNTLKTNHWQSNKGSFDLIRHVAYDMQDSHLISTGNKILKNDGSNFVSEVSFKRHSNGPVRVICEMKTTNLFKGLFDQGSDENEIYHRIKIEHYSFSLYLPNIEDFSNVKVYVDGEPYNFSAAPGGRLMRHEIFGTNSPKTVYSFVIERNE